MTRLIGLSLAAVMVASLAHSQPSADQAPAAVTLTSQEQAAFLSVCAAGQWAARRDFDGLCDFFKKKFEQALADARAKASKADETPAGEK